MWNVRASTVQSPASPGARGEQHENTLTPSLFIFYPSSFLFLSFRFPVFSTSLSVSPSPSHSFHLCYPRSVAGLCSWSPPVSFSANTLSTPFDSFLRRRSLFHFHAFRSSLVFHGFCQGEISSFQRSVCFTCHVLAPSVFLSSSYGICLSRIHLVCVLLHPELIGATALLAFIGRLNAPYYRAINHCIVNNGRPRYAI